MNSSEITDDIQLEITSLLQTSAKCVHTFEEGLCEENKQMPFYKRMQDTQQTYWQATDNLLFVYSKLADEYKVLRKTWKKNLSKFRQWALSKRSEDSHVFKYGMNGLREIYYQARVKMPLQIKAPKNRLFMSAESMDKHSNKVKQMFLHAVRARIDGTRYNETIHCVLFYQDMLTEAICCVEHYNNIYSMRYQFITGEFLNVMNQHS